MTDLDKRELLDHLQRGRDRLAAALGGVDDETALRKPGEGRWSVVECIEHIGLAERLLLSRLRQASPSDAAAASPAREKLILSRAPDRARAVQAPEGSRPAGRFANVSEALAAFDSERMETLRFVENFPGDPRAWLTRHPIPPAPINCYEMLLMVAMHPVRHARQIEEIRAAVSRTD